METMKKSWDDIVRIMTEENALMEGRDPEEIVRTWFERHGFADGTVDEFAKHISGGFGVILDALIEQYVEANPEVMERVGAKELPGDVFSSAIMSIGLGAFTLGYLVRDQLGGRPVES